MVANTVEPSFTERAMQMQAATAVQFKVCWKTELPFNWMALETACVTVVSTVKELKAADELWQGI